MFYLLIFILFEFYSYLVWTWLISFLFFHFILFYPNPLLNNSTNPKGDEVDESEKHVKYIEGEIKPSNIIKPAIEPEVAGAPKKRRSLQPIKAVPIVRKPTIRAQKRKEVRLLRSNEQITREYEENMRQIVANLVKHEQTLLLSLSLFCFIMLSHTRWSFGRNLLRLKNCYCEGLFTLNDCVCLYDCFIEHILLFNVNSTIEDNDNHLMWIGPNNKKCM